MIDEDDDDDMQGDTAAETKYRPPDGVAPFLAMFNAAIAKTWKHSCLMPPSDFLVMEPDNDRSMTGARARCDILRNTDLNACVREPQPIFAR